MKAMVCLDTNFVERLLVPALSEITSMATNHIVLTTNGTQSPLEIRPFIAKSVVLRERLSELVEIINLSLEVAFLSLVTLIESTPDDPCIPSKVKTDPQNKTP